MVLLPEDVRAILLEVRIRAAGAAKTRTSLPGYPGVHRSPNRVGAGAAILKLS
jgi:hypothetical protein